MAKQVLFDLDSLKRLGRGIDQLADAVEVTYGPSGRNVAIEKPFGGALITKDGVQVARSIELEDGFENAGAQIIKKAAINTAERAGDGTTTATILAREVFQGAMRYVASGVAGVDLRRGLQLAMEDAVGWLRGNAYAVEAEEQIEQVATISSNGDSSLGKIIAEAAVKVGKDGIITVDQGKGMHTELEWVEGLQLDKGLLSSDFLPEGKARVEFDDPVILCVNSRLTNVRTVVPALEFAREQSRPIVVIAQDVEAEALSTLVTNHRNGVVQAVALRAPRIGEKRREILEDIATLCGGLVIDDQTGVDLMAYPARQVLGTCRTFKADLNNADFLSGGGDEDRIAQRISELRSRAASAGSEHDREFFQQQVSQLSGGVAIIRVGASTEVEMKNKRALVEDALSATQAAIRGGVVAGGGFTFLRLASYLSDVRKEVEFTTPSQEWGWKLLEEALKAPTRRLLTNAGFDPAPIMAEATAYKRSDMGYDVVQGKFVDFYEEGIIDPTIVLEEALVNSVSSVVALVMSSASIGPVDRPKGE